MKAWGDWEGCYLQISGEMMTIDRINILFVSPEQNDLLCNVEKRMPTSQS